MGSLIFQCPETRNVIEAGIETNDTTLQKLKSCSVNVHCPHCHASHDLKISDGHLFQMKPRRAEVHYIGILRDEIDVGTFIQRALTSTAVHRTQRSTDSLTSSKISRA